MKLNHELIREVLIYIEENSDGKIPKTGMEIDGYTEEEIYYHFKLLLDGGYIDGEFIGLGRQKLRFLSLTWRGHAYLENIRNKYIWEELKREIALKGLKNVSIEIIGLYASKLIKEKLGIQ